MAKLTAAERNAQLSNDAVKGTYAWLERQGVAPNILQKVRVIANESLKLGMMVTILEQEKFRNGLEYELFDD
jgi:hypothetical protein